MRYRSFRRLGWRVSEVGYGMWGLAGWTGRDDAETRQSLQLAVDLGCNFFGNRSPVLNHWPFDAEPGHNWPGDLTKDKDSRPNYPLAGTKTADTRKPVNGYLLRECSSALSQLS